MGCCWRSHHGPRCLGLSWWYEQTPSDRRSLEGDAVRTSRTTLSYVEDELKRGGKEMEEAATTCNEPHATRASEGF
jgi:hypothetical protein